MQTETTIGAPAAGTDRGASGVEGVQDPVITDAESVLDNLLEVVRSQAEDILKTARSDAAGEADGIRARAESERADLLAAAQREAAAHRAGALAAIETAIAELAAVDEYRSRLEAVAATLRIDPAGVEPETSSGLSDTSTVPEAEADPAAEDEGEPVFVEVDPEALQMLAGELGEQACREVVDTFIEELSSQLDYLTAAVLDAAEDPKKVGRTLHNLSSGCATVGAFRVAKLCNTASADTLGDYIDQLVDRGEAVREEVKSLVAAGLIG